MSRPFWCAAFASAAFTATAIRYWADTRTDAEIMLTGLIWVLFLLTIIDVIRTSGPGPTIRNP
jgi:hypothetical protein